MQIDNSKHWLREYGVEIGEINSEGWAITRCPFHNDTTPSCGVNVETQRFICHACDAKGDLIDLLACTAGVSRGVVVRHIEMSGGKKSDDGEETVSPTIVEQYHKILCANAQALTWLRDRKGVPLEGVMKFQLGLDGARVTIPVPDGKGSIVNLRKHSMSPNPQKKVTSVHGKGKRRLFPISALAQELIILTEGELKMVMLDSMGLNAITCTGGAGAWSDEWNPMFKDRDVVIIYDIDKKGVVSGNQRARGLHPFAKRVRLIQLPLPISEFSNGDITNYVVDQGHTIEDLKRLIEDTPAWEVAPLLPDIDDDEKVYAIQLAETSLAKYYHKFVSSAVVISAKDTAPYIVPASFTVRCVKDKPLCAFCPVANSQVEEILKIDFRHPSLLKMVDVSDDRLSSVLRAITGIPGSCTSCVFKINDTRNIEEVRLIPQLRIASTEQEHVVRRAFYVGHGIETNASYVVEGRVVPEPSSQYATLLIYDAKRAVDSLSNFELTPEMRESLKGFQPREWSVEGITERLDEVYADLEANVTRIYERRNLHIFYDIVYHSVLFIALQGKIIKGWIEGIVLGDSGQGKSETARCIRDHYQLGEKIDSKGASVAGLIGGLQDTAKRWFVSWGVITLNNGRLVILEEVKGMLPEVIARLTEVRSSGIAEVSKIEKMRANCRVRQIWISNPRSNRQISTYNYGVEAIKELIGSPEDVRRFDMAMIVASGEVDTKLFNIAERDRPSVLHRFTSEICKNLVLWAWSRNHDTVRFEADAIDEVLAASNRMGALFSSKIPLVEAADQRLKLARIAAALAARTFSTEDGEVLIVRKCHAQFAEEFLNRLYASRWCGYRDFSTRLLNQNTIKNADEVRAYVLGIPHAKTMLQAFLNAAQFTLQDIMDWTELDKDESKRILGFLVRCNAIGRGKNMYFKLPQFIDLLKTIDQDGLADDHPGEKEDF